MLVLATFVLLYGLVSRRLESAVITPPMVFVAFGVIACPNVLGLINASVDDAWIHLVAEVTLVLVLFIDASRIRLSALRRGFGIPLRMLAIGMPLTIAFAGLAAVFLFPEWSIWEALLLAAILTPTDAALGQAVVSHPAVPLRIRQALNVESGLNDGLALPAVLLFAACASYADSSHAQDSWLWLTTLQLTLGPVVGVALGIGGGGLIHWGRTRGGMNEVFQRLGEVALALLAFQAAEFVGGNGFISAFICGMTFGNAYRQENEKLELFVESATQVLVLLSFVIFGAVMVWPSVKAVAPASWLMGVLALTVLRMIPVYIGLTGTGLNVRTKLLLGWFGPRGLASILFGLLMLEEFEILRGDAVFATVAVTVLMSVVAHGVSALPLAAAYSRWVRGMGDEPMAEGEEVPAHPLRNVY